ncbi:MAG: hypothetical protein R2854_08460 [Caldilineaceae bacterium]
MSETDASRSSGEILYEDFMKPLGITQYRLAKEVRLSAPSQRDCPWQAPPSAQIPSSGILLDISRAMDEFAGALRSKLARDEAEEQIVAEVQPLNTNGNEGTVRQAMLYSTFSVPRI